MSLLNDGESSTPFVYRGCHFTCSVVRNEEGLFQPHVLYRYGIVNLEQIALPPDTEPYTTEAEALRHTQQQAMRWVHDRTGEGQGQF